MRVADMLMRSAEVHGNRTAVAVIDGPTTTYSDLLDRVLRFAGGLHKAGVRRGDRVLMMADSGHAYFDVYLAAACLGAAAVPVNTHLTSSELQYIAEHCAPTIAFAGDNYYYAVTGAVGDIRTVRIDGAEYDSLLASAPLAQLIGQDQDVALIIYTSGTTGRPKGVCLSQAALAFNAIVSAVGQAFVPDDAFMSITPLYHAATGTRVYTMIVDGQTHVVLPKFDEKKCFDAIRDFRVTLTLAVPTQLRRLLESEHLGSADLSSLRLLIYGAAPTDPGLVERARRNLPCGLHQGYGLSEAVTNLTALTPEDHERMSDQPDLVASCGRVTLGVTLELRDDLDAPVPHGEIGEICVRTDKTMVGYWNDPKATAETIVDGWLHTGDLAWRDEHGFYYIVGRAKDMLISGGVNIYPVEIETVLYEYPGVVDAAVIGVPHEKWGEVPVAYITAEDEAAVDLDDLRSHCETRLAKMKVPRTFRLIEQFPRTANGKIRKPDLREWAKKSALEEEP